MTATSDVCLLPPQSCFRSTLLSDANQYYLVEPHRGRSNSPEVMKGGVGQYPSRMSSISTKERIDEGDLFTVEKYVPSYRNTFSLFNSPSNGEKKFISELHINIKETASNEGDNQYDFKISNDFQRKSQKFQILHSSDIQPLIGDHIDEPDYPQRYLDHISNSSIIPDKQKEFHHSEKFIYLGGDSNQENQDYELHSYHSEIETTEESRLQSDFKSEQSLINEVSKSFSSKSVQTSKKIDCIFKVTYEKGVETDAYEIPYKSRRETRKPMVNRHNNEYHDKRTSSTDSENICVEYSDSSGNARKKYKGKTDQHHKMDKHHQNIKNDQHHNLLNCIKPKGYFRNFNKHMNQQLNNDTNQDTDIGSYSESFNRTNECFTKEQEELKPLKFVGRKPSILRQETLKASKSNVNQKPSFKPIKRPSDKIDMKKVNESIKNCLNNDKKTCSNSKGENERHSYEIQCLLDNLNIHLQNTVNSNKSKVSLLKANNPQYINNNSFWDNPLNPDTNKSLFLNKQCTSKGRDMNRRKTVNPEIQAIFETLEKSQNQTEKGDFIKERQKESPQLEFHPRQKKLNNYTLNENTTIKKCCDGMGSMDTLNDFRFPSNLKFQKSFELSPYDELVKSHQNSADRRIKSVAAKNGCQIVIDGPISLTDPTSTCHAIRSKIAYRCIVAGSSKDRLDKCLNYLKETFPNTCLRMHTRNNISIKS